MMAKQVDTEHGVVHPLDNRDNFRHCYHILLAEDDYEMRKVISWSLNKQGYQVTECKDGNALMDLVRRILPFFVWSDVKRKTPCIGSVKKDLEGGERDNVGYPITSNDFL